MCGWAKEAFTKQFRSNAVMLIKICKLAKHNGFLVIVSWATSQSGLQSGSAKLCIKFCV